MIHTFFEGMCLFLHFKISAGEQGFNDHFYSQKRPQILEQLSFLKEKWETYKHDIQTKQCATHKQWVNEDIKEEIGKYLETIKMEIQHPRTEEMQQKQLRGKFIAIRAFHKKQETSQTA